MNKNDEIDLKDIFKFCLKCFKNHKIIWIIAIISAIIIGLYKYNTTKVFYQTKMVVSSGLFMEINEKNNFITDIQPVLLVLKSLQEKTATHNYKYIKDVLDIDDVNFLKNIKVSVFSNEAISQKISDNIIIVAEVYDKEQLPLLENSILNYCNKDEFIIDNFEKQSNLIRQYSNIVEEKIQLFDSLKTAFEKNLIEKNDVFFLDMGDWEKTAELEFEQIRYNNLLKNDKPVFIVQHFSDYPQKISEKTKNFSIYFVLVLFFTFVLTLGIEFFKFIKD